MAGNKTAGDVGEAEVVRLVPCPNCLKPLMGLPRNYPMYDVQCTSCTFRAQIFGAGWDIMEKVMKAGFVIPSLFANFKWRDKTGDNQEIRFYPFVPKIHLKMHQ